jgi:hypothetical protein
MRFLTLVFLTGCCTLFRGGRPAESSETRALEESVTAYSERVKPVSDRCRSRLIRAQIAILDETEFRARTGFCGPDQCKHGGSNACAQGCAWATSKECTKNRQAKIAIVLHEITAEQRLHGAIVHEAVHRLHECVNGSSDRGHRDKRLWIESVPSSPDDPWRDSVEHVARKRLLDLGLH